MTNREEELIKQLKDEVASLKHQNKELSEVLESEKETAQHLKKSEKYYHAFFELAADAYFLISLNGEIINLNKAGAAFLELSLEEAIGIHFSELNLLDNDQVPKAQELFAKSKATERLNIEEFIFQRTDGINIAVEIQTQKIRLNGESLIVMLARDISQRKQSEQKIMKHRDFLEKLIKKRTENLSSINSKLQHEIREREFRENALKESKQRYEELVEKAGLGILLDDESGNIKYFNNKVSEIFGYTKSEMKQKNIQELIHPDDKHFVIENHKKRFHGVESETVYEFRGVRSDGSVLFLEVHASPIVSESGITGTRSFIWDRTEKVTREEAHKKSEQKYHDLYNNMRDALAVFSMNGKIIEFNPVLEEMLGLSRKNITGLSINDITPEKWHVAENHIIETQVLKSGYSEVYQKELRHADGSVFPVEVRMYLIKDNAGKPDGLWAVIRNISDRKKIENEMNTLAHAIRSVRECVSVTTLDNTIVFVNDAFLKTYGYEESELLGQNISIIMPKGKSEYISDRIFSDTIDGGWSGEIINRRKNGEEFPVYLSTSLMLDDNKEPIAMIGVAADITERKKIEDQLRQAQKMEAIGKLAGGISHDFNNILSVIEGYTDMALREIMEDNPAFRKLQQVKIAGEKASNLVRKLLAFSRKQAMEPKIVDINTIITDLDNLLMRLIGEDIKTTVFLSDDVSYITADPGQLEQIFVNLIVNARDAINQNKNRGAQKTISIQTENVRLDEKFVLKHRGSKTGEHVKISVHDTGIGMREEIVDKIFEPFFTTKPDGEGTGLGLSTVYGIVKQNAASIFVESELGAGTTFDIYWPVAECQNLPDFVEEKPKVLVKGKESILIVEDEIQVRDVAAETLQSIGYTIFEASNGHEAMEVLNKNQFNFDLVITDVVMPGMGGKELAENIQKIKPELKILFTSGYTEQKIENDGGRLLNGINFLHKPYSIYDLSEKVRKVIEF